jgi:membrane protease YdiL (CAAX protease family)
MRSDRRRRALAALLLLVLGLPLGVGVAWADEPPATAPAADDDGSGEPTAAARLADADLPWLRSVLLYGSATVGLVLLVRLYERRGRRQAGLLPPVEVASPTSPFPPGQALGLTAMFFVAGLMGGQALVRARPELASSFEFQVALMAAVEIPLAAIILLRRFRLAGGTVPGLKTSAWCGLGTWCLGTLLVVPLALLGLVVLEAMGQDVTVYEVVERAADPDRPERLWITLAFGVLVAPIAEEAIFRGLLHPAVRTMAGGGRVGAIAAVAVVSFLFAGMHGHAASFMPLFGLSIVLAIVFERTNSLATVIFAHAYFNFASLLPLVVRRLSG